MKSLLRTFLLKEIIFLYLIPRLLAQDTTEGYSKSIAELQTKYKRLLEGQFKNVLPLALRIASEVDISPECLNAGMKMIRDLGELKEWAALMLDASGKIPSGLFDGTSAELGDYDECLSITSDVTVNGQAITGQYCLATVDVPPVLQLKPSRHFGNYSVIQELERTDTLFKKFLQFREAGIYYSARIGLCVPSTCSVTDTTKILNYVSQMIEFQVSEIRCQTAKPRIWTPDQIIITAILSTILLLTFLGTTLDLLSANSSSATFQTSKDGHSRKCSSLRKWLTVFSFMTNVKKMQSRESNLSFINGIRVLCMVWIVMGHNYNFPSFTYYYRIQRIREFFEAVQSLYFQPIANPTVAVDTFFVISGLLIAYASGPKLSTSGISEKIVFILRRQIRILPAMALTIGLFLLMPLIGSGPLWPETVADGVQVCKNAWWKNFLFINNFWNLNESCLFHTWFLSAFFQLTVLGIFLTILLYRKPLLGSFLLIVLTLASCIVVGILNSFVYDFPPTMSFTVPDVENRENVIGEMYTRPYTHMGPFCVGLAVGFLLKTKSKIRLNNVALALGWGLCCGGFTIVTYGLYKFVDSYDGQTYRILSGLYAGFHRTLWGLSLAWVCVVCGAGYGGYVTRILSWSVFSTLDRLTFFVYLFHPLIMAYYHGVARGRHSYGGVEMLVSFFGFACLSFIVAFFAHVIVEQPINSLDSLLFQKKRVNNSQSHHNVQVLTVSSIAQAEDRLKT